MHLAASAHRRHVEYTGMEQSTNIRSPRIDAAMNSVPQALFADSLATPPSARRRYAWTFGLLLTIACSHGWQDPSALLDELACGMSKEEVVALLTSLEHRVQWESKFDGRLYEVNLRRGPSLSLFFSPEGLYAVRASETVAPMSVFLHPRTNLCTGERTIKVTVLAAGEAWKGGHILVDSQAAGELTDSPAPSATMELPLGDHQVRLRAGDRLSPAAALILTPESSHVTVVFDREDDPPQITTDPTSIWWRPHSL